MVSKSLSLLEFQDSVSFVAHLKTTPYPFRSTRGRYDPCFGPIPDLPITMVSALKEERGKTGHSPCLPPKVHEERHYWSCPLGLESTKDLQSIVFDLTLVSCARCYLPISQAREIRPRVLKGLALGYWVSSGGLRTLYLHSHWVLWPFSTGLQQGASVAKEILLRR